MEPLLKRIIVELEGRLVAINGERFNDGLPALQRLAIRILGQMSLRLHPLTAHKLTLAQTADLDAILVGEWSARLAFKQCLHAHGLIYDELNNEVWIPPSATFTKLYHCEHLEVEVLDPLFSLTSKAIKAPHKNRFLIQEALVHFGDELLTLIERHGGDISYFLEA